MGVLFNSITQGCRRSAATARPQSMRWGFACASRSRPSCWSGLACRNRWHPRTVARVSSMGKFLSFFMLITFAYTLVRFYDSSIPGVGHSFRALSTAVRSSLVNGHRIDGISRMSEHVNHGSGHERPRHGESLMNPYYAIVYCHYSSPDSAMLPQRLAAIVAYGAIAQRSSDYSVRSSSHFLSSTSWSCLFWGWLRAYLGFSFYKVVAAATLNVLSHLS